MFKKLYNPKDLEKVLLSISSFPGIVSYDEVKNLRTLLATGDKFIFHAGDCAESFTEFGFRYLDKQLRIADNVCKNFEKSIFILRGAGQFFKPRSNFYEGDILNYFGDGINCVDINKRTPEVARLEQAYFVSAAKMNYLRQKRKNIFISHEALFTEWEECFLRTTDDGNIYSSGAHMLWLGYRSAKLDSDQLSFLQKVFNPVGIKVGPETDFYELKKIIDILNPRKEKGKIILIARFGAKKINDHIHKLVEFVNHKEYLHIILDPLHGNNLLYQNKKTRKMSDILLECEIFMEVFARISGVSIEFTPDENLECIDGENDIIDPRSLCDPRLNQKQLTKIMHQLTL